MTRYCHHTLSVRIGNTASDRRPRTPGTRSITKSCPSIVTDTCSSCRTIEPELGFVTVIVHWPFASVPAVQVPPVTMAPPTLETTLDVTIAAGMPLPSGNGPSPSNPVTWTVNVCGSPARLSTPGVIATSTSAHVLSAVAAVRSSVVDPNGSVIVVVCPPIVTLGVVNAVTWSVPVPGTGGVPCTTVNVHVPVA